MKQINYVFLMLLALMLCSCKTTTKSNPLQLTERYVRVGGFDKVVINGPMDVQLISGIPENDVRLIGATQDIGYTKTIVKNNTLYVTQKSSSKSRTRLLAVIRVPTLYNLQYAGCGKFKAIGLDAPWFNAELAATGPVDLAGRHIQLSQLTLHGSSDITIHNVTSRNLYVNSTGSDRVCINGEINVNKINMTGTSRIKLMWVTSRELQVKAEDKSYLELAGTVDTLEAVLRNLAGFNARYLRTKYAYVKTYDSARADLQVTKVQNTLASQSSNIYFYKAPKYIGSHMAQSGAVLDLNGMK